MELHLTATECHLPLCMSATKITTVKLLINALVFIRTLASSPLRLLLIFAPGLMVYVNFTFTFNYQPSIYLVCLRNKELLSVSIKFSGGK